MTVASDATADRLRPLLKKLPVVEKKMFGGIGFMLDGNMLIGTTAKGDLLVRIDPTTMADVLKRRGTHEMRMGSKTMTGFVPVNAEGAGDTADLRSWIEFAHAYVKTLTPK